MPSAAALSHLKFRHLLLIQALSELGTLHKAAATLSISQPAATAMLSDLEGLLGFPLFERSHRGVALTGPGAQLMDTVRRQIAEFDELRQAIDRVRHGYAPMLRVGVVPQAYATHLPRAIARFRRQGGTMIHAEEGTARQLIAQLLAGTLDCVVGRMPSSGVPAAWDLSSVDFEHLYAEEICMLAGAGCTDIPPAPLDYAWLASQDWVLQRRDSSVRAALSEAFLRAGVAPPVPIVETTNYVQSLALAAQMAVFTVSPRGPARVQEQRGSVRILAHDLRVSPMDVSFISRKTSHAGVQLAMFRECFRDAVREEDAGGGAAGSMNP